MLDLYELKHLVAFADLGTLSRVSEEFHISTPSVTRTMQHLEESFSVSLFTRGKNKIELNETGKVAVEYARRLLQEADRTLAQVQEFDQRRHTVVVKSCAPAPMWEALHRINAVQPGKIISSSVCQNEEVLNAWENGNCDVAILPFPIEGAKRFMEEKLFVCLPKEHELAKHAFLNFAEINGFNFLLRSELGFWDTLCREKMPASKFLVQTDTEVFDELVRASSLPCFATDYGQQHNISTCPGRVNIPVADQEAEVVFYIAER